MPPNIEFSVAHELVTPYASVDLNAATGQRFMIQADGYKIVPSMRVTAQNITQADGSVLNPRYKTGLVATMKVAYDFGGGDGAPACGADLREMDELLTGAINSILRLVDNNQRLYWQPTGYGDRRMLLDIQTLGWLEPEYDLNGTEASVTFALETPYPYALDATQVVTEVGASDTEPIVNAGNAAFSPVVKVYGPCDAFTLTNLDDLDDEGNPKSIVYDANRPDAISIPGSGAYAELDFFQGTIILNGSSSDLVAGVDPETSDYWRLVPGTNDVLCDGAACTVLSNHAWA